MEQTVYVDLFFVINFSMDFLCFFLASQLLGSKLSPWRTVAASALGGIYANMTLFMSVSGIWELALDILVCALMCVVSFGRIKHLFAHVCVYIAISMVLGGFMTALFELLNKIELPLGEIEGDGISAWLLLFLAVVSGALTLFGGKFFRRTSSRKYTAVTVTLSGKSATLPPFATVEICSETR
ncbi:MAG: sigma-E processing peptidase SpoIIGA [Clostridia bacterium]|nr:sigma-E processing peptidase SpoIIGA [Clostridia bacterium]